MSEFVPLGWFGSGTFSDMGPVPRYACKKWKVTFLPTIFQGTESTPIWHRSSWISWIFIAGRVRIVMVLMVRRKPETRVAFRLHKTAWTIFWVVCKPWDTSTNKHGERIAHENLVYRLGFRSCPIWTKRYALCVYGCNSIKMRCTFLLRLATFFLGLLKLTGSFFSEHQDFYFDLRTRRHWYEWGCS